MLSRADASALIDRPIHDLMREAAALRDERFGDRMTFSPKVFVPLTMLCRDRCGYCTFAKAPAHIDAPFLTADEVLAIARRGAEQGCHEVLFTLGEAPEARYEVAAKWLADQGFASTVEYLVHVAGRVVKETGLLPHANPGALSEGELRALRTVTPSQGMMIESLSSRLHERGGAHFGAPDKAPARRLATLLAAGTARIPYTTGILVGIGETREERLDALFAIRDAHRKYGHVQEVIVQNFLPKPATAMQHDAPCPPEEFLWSVAAARMVLGPHMHIQAPPNLSEPDQLAALIDAGIDDWGGVSPVTIDHVNPERPWPALDALRAATELAGKRLAPRLTVHPEYVVGAEEWIDPALRTAVLIRSDSEGLARDTAWHSGSDATPPRLLPSAVARAGNAVGEVLEGVAQDQELDEAEIVTLLGARGADVVAIASAADRVRRETVGDAVTFVRNRNINYTNVCTFKCRFCAFSKGPLSLNLRGTPYNLGLDEVQRRVVEAVECGATEVCLQGGIHPDFDGSTYLDVTRAVREVAPDIHIHGFTALEVTEGARRLGVDLADYLVRLRDAGLNTLPGTAAEILDDEVRAVICPDKITTDEWLEAHRVAHSVGLRSNVTIMFGTVERPEHVARHILRTRALQRETGGFTEFVPLPFVHMATPIYLQGKARQGPTFRETLLLHAVARLAYRDAIDNIQVSWVKLGLAGAQQILQAGANDLGGTLMDENISRAAGASHGQEVDELEFRAITEPIGRPLEQRTTLYGRTQTVGRRLRAPDDADTPVVIGAHP
ncbi:MAG: 5-amino-6-(D-ribitylamino)uracil--L-tyrosine 4-hydroxyphenyl transferase CofH [Acidimicrobiia bacterium]